MIFSALLRSLKISVGGFLAAIVIKLLYMTIRWRTPQGASERPSGAIILAFWHGRMLMMPLIYRAIFGLKGSAPYMLISQHGDGRLIAAAVRRLGILSVAGSSTRGGRQALRELIRKGGEGSDLGFTPDGPRGPRYKCKSGIALVAKTTGLPVYPCCYSVNRTWQLRSWDGMIVPKPFSKGVVVVGEPILVDRGEEQEVALRRIQEGLDDVTKRADTYWGAASGI